MAAGLCGLPWSPDGNSDCFPLGRLWYKRLPTHVDAFPICLTCERSHHGAQHPMRLCLSSLRWTGWWTLKRCFITSIDTPHSCVAVGWAAPCSSEVLKWVGNNCMAGWQIVCSRSEEESAAQRREVTAQSREVTVCKECQPVQQASKLGHGTAVWSTYMHK